MRELGRLLHPSLRGVVRGKVRVGRVGVARSVVVAAGDLGGAAVVHAGGGGVLQVPQVEHGARGRHRVHEVAPHVDGAALQAGVGEAAAAALHGVGVVLRARVALLLRQAAAQRRRVGGQPVHALLGLGEGGGRGRVVAEAVDAGELAGVADVVWAA